MTTAKYHLRGVEGYYRVYEVNHTGLEVPDPDNGEYVFPYLIDEVKQDVTDVVIGCHGWQTQQQKDDSVKFYSILFKSILDDAKDLAALKESFPATKFQFIGVHWPSAVVHAFARGPPPEPTPEGMRKLQEALRETDPIAASNLNDLIDEAETAGEDLRRVSMEDDLPERIREKLEGMSKALEPETKNRAGINDKESVKEAVKPKNAVRDAAAEEDRDGGNFFSRVGSSALRILFGGVEQIVFGQFERRASVCGAIGVHKLLSTLQKAAAPSTRFHLIGHSLGCHVALSALIGSPESGNELLRKVHSVMLLQGAVPYDAFAKGGQYRAICSQFQPVAGPILVTTSQSDQALVNYRRFHGDPLGRRGARRINPFPLKFLSILGKMTRYGFQKRSLYNCKADRFINETTNFLGIDFDGSHLDVFDPEVTHCLYEALNMRLPDEDYELPDLPDDYFTDKDKQTEKEEESRGWCVVS